jgi:hypothetical protein
MSSIGGSAVAVHDRNTLGDLIWPDTPDGQYAKKFLTPLIQEGSDKFVANVRTEMKVLKIDDWIFPITINDAEYDNCYVTSPYNQYITYAKEELHALPSRAARAALGAFISGFGHVLKLGQIGRVVMVNNWLLSTNLYPRIPEEGRLGLLETLRDFLIERYPGHAILFRSVHEGTDALNSAGFDLVPARQIYLWDPKDPGVWKNRSFQRDKKVLEDQDPEVLGSKDIHATDYQRIVDLYNGLYLQKYSIHNPHFTTRFVRLAHEEGILELKAIRENGVIDGVMGYFARNGMMTTPLFGYDITRPASRALYRKLMTLQSFEARDKGLLLHQSAGAASFKRARGALPHLEYNAVYCRHLPVRQVSAWKLLARTTRALAEPLLRRYEL